ncbi:MAG: hypothetical protein GY710_11005 [Desulfobacteraceae bacterium]|nr:hypothetical protein [Desulfobacteraceae bacterium]
MVSKGYLVFFVFLVFLLFSVPVFSQTITILHLNDTHGHIETFGVIANEVNKIRKEKGEKNVLFLHAGDFNTGTPISNLTKAKADIDAFNLMKLDALAIGNHEFDNRLNVLKEQEKRADFPFLACNVYKDDTLLFLPYVIKNINGLKIGIIGVINQETEKIGGKVKGVVFTNAVDAVQKYKKLMEEKENPDLIVVLAHLGDYKKGDRGKYEASRQLADKISGVVIVDGHSHTPLKTPININNSIIVQAGSNGKYLGQLQLDLENKKIIHYKGKLIKIDLNNEKDQRVSAKLKEHKTQMEKEQGFDVDEVILKDNQLNLTLDGARQKDTLLAQIVADAIKVETKADIAFLNGGGIRSQIKKGKITSGDIYNAVSIPNKVVLIKLKGDEIMDILKEAAMLIGKKDGAHLHTSNLTWEYDQGKVENVKVNGEKINSNKIYKVAMTDYMAKGAGYYTKLKKKESEFEKTFEVIGKILIKYFKDHKTQLNDRRFEERNKVILSMNMQKSVSSFLIPILPLELVKEKAGSENRLSNSLIGGVDFNTIWNTSVKICPYDESKSCG